MQTPLTGAKSAMVLYQRRSWRLPHSVNRRSSDAKMQKCQFRQKTLPRLTSVQSSHFLYKNPIPDPYSRSPSIAPNLTLACILHHKYFPSTKHRNNPKHTYIQTYLYHATNRQHAVPPPPRHHPRLPLPPPNRAMHPSHRHDRGRSHETLQQGNK